MSLTMLQKLQIGIHTYLGIPALFEFNSNSAAKVLANCTLQIRTWTWRKKRERFEVSNVESLLDLPE